MSTHPVTEAMNPSPAYFFLLVLPFMLAGVYFAATAQKRKIIYTVLLTCGMIMLGMIAGCLYLLHSFNHLK